MAYSIPIFPGMPTVYQGFSLHKKPTFASIVNTPSSGREVTGFQQIYPLWEYELTYEVLRDEGQNIDKIPYTSVKGFSELQSLLSLYLVCNGTYGLFYYNDLDDNSRTGQVVGVGDGTTTRFVVPRTWGAGSYAALEPIGAFNVLSTVYLNGVSTILYGVTGVAITFGTAPAAGVVITADFTFYYACRFIDDSLDFEQFFQGRWTLKSLKFRSVRPDTLVAPVPPPEAYYFEVTLVDTGVEFSACVGIATAAFTLQDPANLDVNVDWPLTVGGAFIQFNPGGDNGWGHPIRMPGGLTGSPGETIGFCIHKTKKLMWYSNVTVDPTVWAGGNGIATPDPATFVNGFDFSHNLASGAPIHILGGGGRDPSFAPTDQWGITNGDLTATTLTINSVDTIISNLSNSAGKLHFEFTNNMIGDADLFWGIAEAGITNTTILGTTATSLAWRRGTTDWIINNVQTASGMPKPGIGDLLALEIDLTNGLAWIQNHTANPGTWFGNGGASPNPATGTNGFAFTPLGASVFLAFCSNSNGAAEGAIMNPGSSTFIVTPSTGFSPWNSSDQWSTTFGIQGRRATEILNAGSDPFVIPAIPTGYVHWGSTTWNPSDSSVDLIFSNANLTVKTGVIPGSNQPTAFVRSISAH